MLWDTKIAIYFTAYVEEVLLWYKTNRNNILANQKCGNCQENLN